jgi:hypothetical protein
MRVVADRLHFSSFSRLRDTYTGGLKKSDLRDLSKKSPQAKTPYRTNLGTICFIEALKDRCTEAMPTDQIMVTRELIFESRHLESDELEERGPLPARYNPLAEGIV